MSSFRPKNSSVSFGWRKTSRFFSFSVRCAPASDCASSASTDPFTSAALVAAVEGGEAAAPPPHAAASAASAKAGSAERRTKQCMANLRRFYSPTQPGPSLGVAGLSTQRTLSVWEAEKAAHAHRRHGQARVGEAEGTMTQAQVVIVGGGFGGLTAAKALARAPVRVTLVDRTNHHLFQPLLYQVASAGLSPADIASPIRSILARQSNAARAACHGHEDRPRAEVRRARRRGDSRTTTSILAAGAHTNYFGHPEWEPYAPGLKSLDDAIEVRRPDAARVRARRADDRRERAQAAPHVRRDRRRGDRGRARRGVRRAAPVRPARGLPRDSAGGGAGDPARGGTADLAELRPGALAEGGPPARAARRRRADGDAGDGDRRARRRARRRADRCGDDRVGGRGRGLADRASRSASRSTTRGASSSKRISRFRAIPRRSRSATSSTSSKGDSPSPA